MSEEERERDSAPPGEVVVAAEGEDPGEEDWSPFDEIQEDFKPRPIAKVTAADGLPTHHAPVNTDDIPVLSPESLVCMGDYSEFVLRGQFGDVLASFSPAEVERSPHGHWRVQLGLAQDRMKLSIHRFREFVKSQSDEEFPDNTLVALRMMLTTLGYRVSPDWVQVEPRRPACAHYARQLTQSDLNAQIKVMLRVCAARRTTEGAFMSLRDRGMWACELRHPPIADGFEILQSFDERKMREGQQRELVPMFGGNADDENGIFGGPNGGE